MPPPGASSLRGSVDETVADERKTPARKAMRTTVVIGGSPMKCTAEKCSQLLQTRFSEVRLFS